MDIQDEYNTAVSKITKGKDKKTDSKLMLSPYINWEQFLSPAPLAISLLGELVVISSKTDFSLKEHMPDDGYKYLRYPESFRACLVQITNSGWRAFNEAHTSMDQIRLMSGNVDTHVREAVRLILAGSKEEIETVLPLSLTNIDEIANESLELAKNIEKRFGFVVDLTGELLEASKNTQSIYERKVQQTQKDIEKMEIEIQFAENAQKAQERRLKKMEEDVNRAQNEYEAAVKDLPGGAYMLAMSFTEGIVDAVKNFTSLPIEVVKGLGLGSYQLLDQILQRTKSNEFETIKEHVTKCLDARVAEHNVLSQVTLIDPNIQILQDACGVENTPNIDLNLARNGSIDAIKESLTRQLAYVSGEKDSGAVGKEVCDICSGGIGVCNNLINFAANLAAPASEKVYEVQKKCADLRLRSRTLMARATKEIGRNPLDEAPPCIKRPHRRGNGQGVLDNEMDNARFRIETAKHNFDEFRSRQDKAEEEMQKANKKMCEALQKMKSLDIDKIDFNTVRESLQEGIAVLAQVKAHWGNLVVFFQEISNIIKCCMNTSLKKFVQTVEGRRQLDAKGIMMTDAFRANMYDQTLQASRTSYVVSEMAGSYVNISTDHLMTQLSILSEMTGLDPVKHDDKLRKMKEKLHNLCEDAQLAILSKIKKQHTEHNALIEKRMLQIKNEIEPLLPPSQNQKAIEQAVNKAFDVDDIVG